MAAKHRPILLITITSGLLLGCWGQSVPRLIDLTWTLKAGIPVHPFFPPYQFTIVYRDDHPGGYYLESNEIAMNEHTGTHIDAPAHFARGAWRLDQIPLGHLTGPGVMIDVRDRIGDNTDYAVTAQDLQDWEREYGHIPEGGIIMLRSGWGEQFYEEGPVPYLGVGQKNDSLLHSPGLHPDAAQWLVDNRDVKVIGFDTVSADTGDSKTCPTHKILLPNNIIIIENVGHLNEMPPTGSTVYAMPIKIGDGSGAPSRVFAIIDERTSDAGLTTSDFILVLASAIVLIVQAI
ncbi:isatin hydrolase-like [Branchiostoma floridae]|uniref:Isatin hydrolase-like n=1 Tax=Branchiostoma floridae TaxID=7739 RepID=A0A9J7N6W0_BRAFL|nr:isatin hydrolase-like [Branchiostoma floridae]